MPAAAVVQAPDRHREQLLGVGPEDPEDVAVEVSLVDEFGIVDRRAGHDVELADVLHHRQVLERRQGVVDRLGIGRQADVELVANDVHRHLVVEQEGDQIVQALALGRLIRVVVVDRQLDRPADPGRGVVDVECLLRVLEGVLDVLLAQDVVPGAAAQPVGLSRAVGNDLVGDVEADQGVGAAAERPVQIAEGLGDAEDMVVQSVAQDRLVRVARGERGAVVVLEEPVRNLLVPDEGVAPDAETLALGVCHLGLGLGVDTELLVRAVPRLGLHVVLERHLVEVLQDQFGVGAGRLAGVDGHADGEGDGVLEVLQVLLNRGTGLGRDDDVIHKEGGVGAVGVRGLEVDESALGVGQRVGSRDLLP